MARKSAYVRRVEIAPWSLLCRSYCSSREIALEERFLKRDMDGYAKYTVRVPYRLVAGLL